MNRHESCCQDGGAAEWLDTHTDNVAVDVLFYTALLSGFYSESSSLMRKWQKMAPVCPAPHLYCALLSCHNTHK